MNDMDIPSFYQLEGVYLNTVICYSESLDISLAPTVIEIVKYGGLLKTRHFAYERDFYEF